MFKKLFDRLKTAERSLDKAWGYDISTPAARKRAHRHFQWIDHGILRHYWTNLFEIAPGAWRSNQPDRARIQRYHQMGIHTILNLRGTNLRSPYLFETEACQEFGLTVVSHAIAARRLVVRQILLDLLDTFDTIEKPFVLHCKSGADRAGLASALYLLHCQGASVEDAKKQLSFKYLHIKSSSTGILDHVLDRYQVDLAKKQIPIRNWIETVYDPVALTASYKASR
jgi:protein tyrosine/serine phosphatase